MTKPAQHRQKGLVVLFEGVDGVGKTTQLKLAQEALAKLGRTVHATRNLGGTPIGEALREVTLSPTERSPETDLYISVAIQSALAESIQAERQDGKVVLVDRGPLSLAAYHIYGNGVDGQLGWRYADDGMRRFSPDLVILYQTDLDTALSRTKRRQGKTDYFASQPKAYFKRVVRGFSEASKRYPVRIINASGSIDEVHRETMAAIESLLPKNQA
jgi:dTMP kinase